MKIKKTFVSLLGFDLFLHLFLLDRNFITVIDIIMFTKRRLTNGIDFFSWIFDLVVKKSYI